MQRIDVASNTAVLPTPAATGTPGYFRLPADSVQTIVTNDWANLVQEALCRVIENSGYTLDKTNFSLFAQAMQTGLLNYGVTTNVSNAYSITYTTAPKLITGALVPGSVFRAKINATNTGAATLAINGGTALNIKLANGLALVANHLVTNMVAEFLFNGTNLILLNPNPVYIMANVSGNQGITPGTTKFNVGTTADDLYGMWSAGAQRFNIPLTGRWKISSLSGMSNTGVPYAGSNLGYVNGTPTIQFFTVSSSGADTYAYGEASIILNSGDFVELFLEAVTNDVDFNPTFSLQYLGR